MNRALDKLIPARPSSYHSSHPDPETPIMCCFSRNVKLVADTNIFARASKDGRQFLVYSMKLEAAEPLAMILPLPTPKDSKEDSLRFINLEKYPDLFDEMRTGFPLPKPGGRGGNG